ncbi:type II secretion system protein M [Shewanella algidipiscicola]|uniref:type II secretion system protein M n=1 Tax=Shewanella algidipiscicola TaxID=614070 RepID=UPI000D78B3AE|nr:type II secretion system protein M [Shewanella algidipiscicola]
MENLKTWWNGLILREQQLVATCGVVLMLGVLYWGVWTPISEAEQDAERALQAQQATLTYVKQTANKIVALQNAGGKKAYSSSLSATVTQTAKRYGLAITRMQPQGQKIQVWMDEVPFNSLLSYLSDLVQQQGLSLDSIDLAQADAPGLVKVRRIQLSQ